MRLILNGQQAFGKATLEAILNKGEDEIVGVFCAPLRLGARGVSPGRPRGIHTFLSIPWLVALTAFCFSFRTRTPRWVFSSQKRIHNFQKPERWKKTIDTNESPSPNSPKSHHLYSFTTCFEAHLPNPN